MTSVRKAQIVSILGGVPLFFVAKQFVASNLWAAFIQFCVQFLIATAVFLFLEWKASQKSRRRREGT